MTRKPKHHIPEIFCTVNDRLEKTMKAAEVNYTPVNATPVEKKDAAVLPLHHSLYAPSSLPAIALCPARVRMSLGLPELPDTDDSSEGDRLHKAIVARNFSGLDSEQMDLIRKCDAVLVDISGPYGINREETLYVMGSNFEELTYGTADIVIPKSDKVVVLDWKFGRNEVEEAANNLQLATYAVGAAQKYGVDKVECHVFQPRIHHHSVYTFTDIPAVLASIEAVIDRARVSEWVFNPSEDACRYCRAKFVCKPCLASLSSLPVVAADPEASQQDLAVRMPDLIKAAKQAAKLSDAILSKAKDMISQGIPVPGYFLKDGNEVRFVSNIIRAFDATKDLIPQEEFLKLCSVSVGAYEEKFIENFKKVSTFSEMTLDECKEEFEKRTAGAIGKKQNAPSLAEVKVKK